MPLFMQTENANPQTSKAAAKRSKPSETSNPPMETLRAKGLQKQLHMAAHEHDKLLDGPTPEADPYCHFSLELQERTGVARQRGYMPISWWQRLFSSRQVREVPCPTACPTRTHAPCCALQQRCRCARTRSVRHSGYLMGNRLRLPRSGQVEGKCLSALPPTHLSLTHTARSAPLPTPLCTATHTAVHCYPPRRALLHTPPCTATHCAVLPTPLCTATHTAMHCYPYRHALLPIPPCTCRRPVPSRAWRSSASQSLLKRTGKRYHCPTCS